MIKSTYCFLILTIILSSVLSTDLDAQNSSSSPEISDSHIKIQQYNGRWNGKVTMYQPDGDIAMQYEGLAETFMMMDGRYQVTNFTSEFQGETLLGQSLLAFDTTTQEFTNTWIDNAGTGVLIMRGVWNPQNSNQIQLEGNTIMQYTREECYIRQEHTFISPDEQLMELWYDLGDGEYKAMEVTYTRE